MDNIPRIQIRRELIIVLQKDDNTDDTRDKFAIHDAKFVCGIYWIPRERTRIRKYVDYIYLIAFESVQQRDAYDGGLDTGVMCQRGKAETLHLDVHHAGLLQCGEVIHLVGLCKLAKRTVQTTLALVEVVRAHGFADDGVVGIVAMGQGFQVAGQLLVELGRSAHQFSEHHLQRVNSHLTLTINFYYFYYLSIPCIFLKEKR